MTELASRLRFVMLRTSRRMRQEAGGDLSPTQTATLGTISRLGPITPSELADAERVKRPTATRIVAELERQKLIERSADPSDGRGCLLAISAEGKTELKRLRRRKDAFLARRMRELGADELALLDDATTLFERLLTEEPADHRPERTAARGKERAS